ncbi:DMT family transporter [Hydrogenophaga sp. BPS33]|uniref:DMT family transporter n=1 Tax=Hydrogenophaga sp. BPS33 TaxID=2651974 RepID=UPI00131FA8B7|nr:DMT family transporter [Hydrogenophaga sp. BPS33]QHE83831.1 DMT family transporter [Hydrogenophaga sp. BPS33]
MSQHNRSLALGIGFGAAAGAAWGFVFLAPELARHFSPLQLSAGRYLSYGLVALILIAPRWRAVAPRLGRAEWWALLRLSLLGNIFYYVLLASAVQLGGMAMTSLVIGFLPVAVTLIGSRGHGAVPLRQLALTLGLGVGGIVCVAWQALGMPSEASVADRLTGFLCALGALIAWTAYAVSNSRWLARLDHVSSHDWSLLTGLVTGGLALLLAIPAFSGSSTSDHTTAQWGAFIGVVAGMAVVASVLGNAFWNHASRLLPMTMIGQMILFETLFALLYGFLWEARWPTALEALAMVLVSASVLAGISAHQPRQPLPEH